MPGEMDAELRNTLRTLQTAVEGVGRAQKKTTDEVARFASEAKKAFGGAAKGGEETDRSGRKATASMRELGSAIGRVGGPLGDMVSRLTGLQNANPVLGRLALAATAVGTALGFVVKGLERSGEQARESAQQWRAMSDAILDAKNKSLAVGTAGLGQRDEQRKLIAGGPEAVSQAKLIASGYGVDESDANQGVAAIYAKYGQGARARATVEVARKLQASGAMSFSEGAAAAIDFGADASVAGVGEQVAGRIYAEKTGRRGVDPVQALNEAIDQTASSPYLRAAAKVQDTERLTRGAQRDAVTDGRAGVAALNDLAATRDPVSAAVSAVANANARAAEELRRIADGQNGMLEWLKHYTVGSERDKLERFQNGATAAAAAYAPGG